MNTQKHTSFHEVTAKHLDTIFAWLKEPHIQEFWDNTQGHKDDIINFTEGRKSPSPYCDGKYVYWIASVSGQPFAMLMTIKETPEDHQGSVKLQHLSKTGHTYGIDYMIGDKDFFGKGYGARTLSEFIDFFRRECDASADTFIIDPASDNPKAKHVYMKAGFKHACDFVMEGDVSGAGKMHHLLIKRFTPEYQLLPATITDYPVIQNMARFYVYDRTKYMGWECPEDGLFECIDFKHYFENPEERVFLVKVAGELAGFVMLDKERLVDAVDWNMGEFFILAKFQGSGIGSYVMREIFKQFPGKWSIACMPKNISATKFWHKVIAKVTHGDFTEVFKTADELRTTENPDPYDMNIWIFDTESNKEAYATCDISIRPSIAGDISDIVALSHQKRLNYEKAQALFWRYAGDIAEESQAAWFRELLTHKDYIMLTAWQEDKIVGFIIGKLMPAPEVYNPGGPTLMIDDFCVETPELWQSVGTKLIEEIKILAKAKGATQILVVSGDHDNAKCHFLQHIGLTVASRWYVGGIA
ncbi:MAG: GNAT family N-acetyltransferase [Pseudomonadota bacterium]